MLAASLDCGLVLFERSVFAFSSWIGSCQGKSPGYDKGMKVLSSAVPPETHQVVLFGSAACIAFFRNVSAAECRKPAVAHVEVTSTIEVVDRAAAALSYQGPLVRLLAVVGAAPLDVLCQIECGAAAALCIAFCLLISLSILALCTFMV